MKNYLFIGLLLCSLIACRKSDNTQVPENKDSEKEFTINYENIKGTKWVSKEKVDNPLNTRFYYGVQLNPDSTVKLLDVGYSLTDKREVKVITSENDKIVLKYKTINSNNLNDTERELLKTYNILIFQEYESLTDSQKQEYLHENPIGTGPKTKISFLYLRIDKSATGETKLIDTFDHTFSKTN